MAKLTLSQLQTIVSGVIDEDLIGVDTPFVPTYDAITGLVIKIGKQLMLDSNFEDRLPELDGETLPFGSTIEEWFTDLVLPVAYDADGSTNMAPKRPTFEEVVYSYALAKKQFPTTVDDAKLEQGFLGQEQFAALVASITKALYDSLAIYKYALKRQLIGEMINRVPAASASNKRVVVLAQPADTATAEAFAKSVKTKVEYATHIHDDLTLTDSVVSRSDISNLTLYVLEGLQSILDIDLEAGTFNVGKVQIPVTIKSLEDFGSISGAVHPNAYAVLVDTRGLRVHTVKETASKDYNGQGEFTNFYLNYQPTGFISKYTNIVVWEHN